MVGRFLAACAWLARPLRRGPLRRFGSAAAVAVAIALFVLAAVPIVVPQLDPQPADIVVDDIMGGVQRDGWVRLRGRIVSLPASPTVDADPGRYGLLVDADNPLRAIVVRGAEPLEAAAASTVTGTIEPATIVVEPIARDLPSEARVAGTPPRIVPDLLVELDPVPTPVRSVLWPLAIPPLLLGLLLSIGSRVPYPLFRASTEVDVLVAPLGVGERIPAAYGGRVGPNTRPLDDPGGVLLLVRRGPNGNLLTAQPLADDGGVAPQPVTIGGSWSHGRIGYVHTVRETVAALTIRSELVDATFLFARTTERDRVAALVSVRR